MNDVVIQMNEAGFRLLLEYMTGRGSVPPFPVPPVPADDEAEANAIVQEFYKRERSSSSVNNATWAERIAIALYEAGEPMTPSDIAYLMRSKYNADWHPKSHTKRIQDAMKRWPQIQKSDMRGHYMWATGPGASYVVEDGRLVEAKSFDWVSANNDEGVTGDE